ncbi:MAG: 3'-5' exonuclease [Syntrophothermus sp.]
MSTFTAIDFETANSARNSICQIGLVRVVDGEIFQYFSQLIRPPDNHYNYWNTKVHGITPRHTLAEPAFYEVWPMIRGYIEDQLVVAHNVSFDAGVLRATLQYYKLRVPEFKTDCTYRHSKMNLKKMCDCMEIELLKHHDAMHDAMACARAYIKIREGFRFPGRNQAINQENS